MVWGIFDLQKFFIFSPFKVNVRPGVDASKVVVTGDGVQPSGVGASLPVSFKVDPREAGNAGLVCIIQVK